MDCRPVVKPGSFTISPNLTDYATARASFDWGEAKEHLAHQPGDPLNIAFEAIDRHARGPLRQHVALRWIGKKSDVRDFTYGDLAEETSRFASALRSIGVGNGDRVFVLSNRVPELYIAALGTIKNGSVFAPLFSAFGPEPIHTRMSLGDGKVLVTTDRLYKRKIAEIRDRLPALEHVIIIADRDRPEIPKTILFEDFMARGDSTIPAVSMDAEDMALLHFTSGTTGAPKGAVHVHGAVLHHWVSAYYALDLHPEDIFWCTADPGWVTGTSYGIIAPFLHGVTNIVDEGDFDADRWYGIIQDQRVTVWYTAPTAIRMLTKSGTDITEEYDLSSLRFVASVGEPLNPEGVVWGLEAFGMPIHDNWWQTETGGIMIANYQAEDIRPGSMGRPVPGVDAGILALDDRGDVIIGEDGHVVEAEPLVEGELAVRVGWPSMFRGYLGMDDRYEKCFVDGWYRTGDRAEKDQDGFFWFIGRGDDVIKSAGHLIGPFEVESALVAHSSVAEAGVIGVPDPVAGEIVKAYVSLHQGYEWSDELERELIGWSRSHLGASVAPRSIVHEQDLPHTRSGKIMRRLLKARELGLPEGDLSSLDQKDEEAHD
jgi:acetyl-CoA synthetase